MSTPFNNTNESGATRVSRGTAILPQTGVLSLFTVTGRVMISDIIGEVTDASAVGANNMKLIAAATVGADVDLCAVVDVDADAVGTLYTITGTLADAMVATTSGAVKSQALPQIVSAGTIDLSCSGSKAGKIKWTLFYIPIDLNSTVTAVAIP